MSFIFGHRGMGHGQFQYCVKRHARLIVFFLCSSMPITLSQNGSLKIHSLYLEQFLSTSLTSIIFQYPSDSITKYYLPFLQRADAFRDSARMPIKQHFVTKYEVPFSECESTKAAIIQSMYVKNSLIFSIAREPVATIQERRTLGQTNFCFPWYFCSSVFLFQLHRKLALNMTFLKLHFNSGAFDCCKGSLSVTSFQFNFFHLQEHLKAAKEYMFCGHIAKFAVFWGRRQLFVTRSSQEFTIFEFEMMFQILSSKSVVSHSVHFADPQLSMVTSFVNYNEQVTGFHFIIQVKKVEHIIVDTDRLEGLTLHNGPGEMSDIISCIRGTYITHSFICYAKLLIADYHTHVPHNMLNFTVEEQKSQIITVRKNTTRFSFSQMNESFVAVLKLNNTKNMNINITIFRMKYEGFRDDLSCIYGGVAGISGWKQKFTENMVLCYSVENRRRFYSSEVLVLYQFKQYSNLSIVFTVSLTECQSLKLNDCVFDYLCNCIHTQIDFLCSKRNDIISRCTHFTSALEKELGNLTARYIHDTTFPGQRKEVGRLGFSGEAKCLILQFFRQQNDLRELSNQLNFGHSRNLHPTMAGCDSQIELSLGRHSGSHFMLHIQGSLTKRYGRLANDWLLSKGTEDIEIYGSQDNLRLSSTRPPVSKKRLTFVDKLSFIKLDESFEEYLMPKPQVALSSGDNNNSSIFSVHADILLSDSVNSFVVLYVRLLPQVFQSWINVIVRKKLLKCSTHSSSHITLQNNPKTLNLRTDCILVLKSETANMSKPHQKQQEILVETTHQFGESKAYEKDFLSLRLHKYHIFQSLIFANFSHSERAVPLLFPSMVGKIHIFRKPGTKGCLNIYASDTRNKKYKNRLAASRDLKCKYYGNNGFYNLTCVLSLVCTYSTYLFFGVKHFTTDIQSSTFVLNDNLHVRKSWNEAQVTCSQQNAVLPIFLSRNDIESFISLIKYSYQFPLMEAIYIGLHLSKVKVGCCCYCGCCCFCCCCRRCFSSVRQYQELFADFGSLNFRNLLCGKSKPRLHSSCSQIISTHRLQLANC